MQDVYSYSRGHKSKMAAKRTANIQNSKYSSQRLLLRSHIFCCPLADKAVNVYLSLPEWPHSRLHPPPPHLSYSILNCPLVLLLTIFSGSAVRGKTIRCEKKFLRGSRIDLSLNGFILCPFVEYQLWQRRYLLGFSPNRVLSCAFPPLSPLFQRCQFTYLRPCSHHRFETRTVPEPFQLSVFRPVPLRPLVPVRADHLAMWSQWNGSGTVPVGSVVWTVNWTRSGTSPVSEVASCTRVPACACIICGNACYASFYHNMSLEISNIH